MKLIRIFSLLGLAISAYLLFLKLSGTITSVVGCGAGSGCANVLGSKWSQFFGIPVSALSLLLYLGIFVLTFRKSRFNLVASAFILIAAAVWFLGLQAITLKSFCPWCFATHLIGLATAGAILFSLRPRSSIPSAAITAVVLIGGLAIAQLFGPAPDTHAISEETDTTPELPIYLRGTGPLIDFSGKKFRPATLPHLGPLDAKHFLVKYFDYTCGSCKDLHGDLHKLQEKYPKDIAVIFLPTPLNRSCNRYVHPKVKDHRNACKLARIALAVWHQKPETFPEAHDYLFTKPTPAAALEKLGPLDLEDPWIDELLTANTHEYRTFVKQSPRMPKLRIKDGKIMSGLARTSDQFITLIAKELNLP